jgi:hypothetical protein
VPNLVVLDQMHVILVLKIHEFCNKDKKTCLPLLQFFMLLVCLVLAVPYFFVRKVTVFPLAGIVTNIVPLQYTRERSKHFFSIIRSRRVASRKVVRERWNRVIYIVLLS